MIKQQVYKKFIALNFQTELPSNKGKPLTQFQQKVCNVADKGIFNIPLVRLIPQSKKIKAVRILKQGMGAISISRFKPSSEIRNCRTLTQVELMLDMLFKCFARPGLMNCFSSVKFTGYSIGDFCNQNDNMKPWQLVSRLLTNCAVRAFLCKKPHIFKIRSG